MRCPLCVNDCRIPEGQRGFCGLRENQQGKLVHLAGTPSKGILHWYHDPLPTNCVADWVCEGHTQYGHVNLAVFYGACSFNCLFCQNWHYRQMDAQGKGMSAEELAAQAQARTFCVCYFGGDPTPQMPHALATSRILAEQGVRVCWETNGTMQPKLLDRAVRLSLETGGVAAGSSFTETLSTLAYADEGRMTGVWDTSSGTASIVGYTDLLVNAETEEDQDAIDLDMLPPPTDFRSHGGPIDVLPIAQPPSCGYTHADQHIGAT